MREQIDVDNINRQLQLYDWSKSLTRQSEPRQEMSGETTL